MVSGKGADTDMAVHYFRPARGEVVPPPEKRPAGLVARLQSARGGAGAGLAGPLGLLALLAHWLWLSWCRSADRPVHTAFADTPFYLHPRTADYNLQIMRLDRQCTAATPRD